VSRNHRRARIALSRKIERDMELAAREERERVRKQALARNKEQAYGK
jgi:predicted flap endonuclease-1-like 5' DNA nuclease